MGTDELVALIADGAAILGASRGEDLRPEAFRVWGAEVHDDRVRILVNADAEQTRRDLRDGAPVAVTFTDITTFRSLQTKGVVEGDVEAPGPADVALLRTYDEVFTDALKGVGHPSALPERLRPLAVFAVTYRITELFDQTPGPDAGALIRSGRPSGGQR